MVIIYHYGGIRGKIKSCPQKMDFFCRALLLAVLVRGKYIKPTQNGTIAAFFVLGKTVFIPEFHFGKVKKHQS
jgi:hypothetical protein